MPGTRSLSTLSVADQLIAASLSPDGQLFSATTSLLNSGQAIDWGVVLERADALHMVGPLEHAIRGMPIARLALSQDQRDAIRVLALHLQRMRASRRTKTQALQEQLDKILMEAGRLAIPIVLLKGAHIAHLPNQKPEDRPMSDIDLLVRTDDMDRFEAMVQRLGYTPTNPSSFWRDSHFHLCPLAHPAYRHIVEIHWGLTAPASRIKIDMAAIWARAEPFLVNGRPTLTLAPEDNLIYLVIHGFFIDKLRHNGLRQIRDIALLIGGTIDRMNWNAVVDRSRALEICRPVYLALELVRLITGTSIPDSAMSQLKPPDWNDELIDEAYTRLFWSVEGTQLRPGIFRAWRQAGPVGVIRLIGREISPEVLRINYGPTRFAWMAYLYVPRRVFGWIATYWRVVLATMRLDRKLQARLRRVAALDHWLT